MSKITMQNVKIWLASIVSIFLLFFIFLFFQNGTTLIVTMESKAQKPLQAQIYFTKEGQPFIEKNSRRSYKVKKNNYYFKLPKPEEMQYVRFDPARKKSDISIKKITLSTTKWFKTRLYDVPTTNVIPVHQIKKFKASNNEVSFFTIGNDPHFNMRLASTYISKTKNIHLDLLLLAMILFGILMYLYHIYKTQELDHFLTSKLILYALFFALALFKVDYYKDNVRFGYPPDELAHLAYIQHVHTHDELMPDFENMVMLNNKSAGNYLSHPPLYYKIMNLVYDKNYSIIKNVDNFRILNVIIFIAAFLLILYLGFSSQISLLGHFVYLSLISSIPMFAYLGGSITNDNLAILGGLIFILGLKRILENNYTTLSYFVLGFGIFISYFSKLTVAILIFFSLALLFAYLLKSRQPFKVTKLQIAMLALFALPIIYYQFYIFTHFHALVPTFNHTHPEQYLTSPFFIPEEHRSYLTSFEWFLRMKQYFIEGWFGIHSHHSLIKNSILEYSGILFLHILALITLIIKCDENSKVYCMLGKIGLISFILLMVVQYIFSYKAHLASGYMGGLQPRYLLPFMFAFAIMASLFVERFKQYFLFNIFIILICIHAIYSDFFYFLQYYQ